MKNNVKIFIRLSVLFLILGVVVFSSAADAQEGKVIITWESDSFYPSNYQGKASAVNGSDIIISATLVIDNEIINPLDKEYVWRVNGLVFDKGVGMDSISLNVDQRNDGNYSVSVLIRDEGENYQGIVNIPVGDQELIIEVPSPGGVIEKGNEITLTAVPYFFNASSFNDLLFTWKINGTKQDGQNSNQLVLDIGSGIYSGQKINITSEVINKRNGRGESSTKLITIR